MKEAEEAEGHGEVEVIDLGQSPSVEETRNQPPRVSEVAAAPRRSFPIALPSVLRVVPSASPQEAGREDLVTIEANGRTVADYAETSAECRGKGPLIFVARGNGSALWRRAAFPLVFLATAITAVATTLLVSAMRARVSGEKRIAVIVAMQSLVSAAQCFYVLAVVSAVYPSFTRSRLVVFLCALPEIVLVFAVAMYHCVLPYNATYFVIWLVIFPCCFILPFHIARAHWRHTRKKAGRTPKHPLYWPRRLFTLSGLAHVLAVYWMLSISIINLFMESVGNIIVLLALAGFPFFVAILWVSLARRITWSTGHAVAVPLLMNATYFLVVLLKTVLQLPIGIGNPIVTAVKFLLWYAVYGGLFSLTQTTISIATASCLSPQWLLLSQFSLEVYMGIAFVNLKTDTEFWVTFVLQSLWALVQNTGLKVRLWWLLRDSVVGCLTQRKRAYTAWELVERENYNYILNIQAIVCDLLSSVFLPVVIAIDSRTPWGCSIACHVTPAMLSVLVSRYAIVLLFRVIAGAVSMAVYCFRFTRLTRGCSRWREVFAAMVSVAQLHFLRHLPLFCALILFMFTELFPGPPGPEGFHNSLSSSSASTT